MKRQKNEKKINSGNLCKYKNDKWKWNHENNKSNMNEKQNINKKNEK